MLGFFILVIYMYVTSKGGFSLYFVLVLIFSYLGLFFFFE